MIKSIIPFIFTLLCVNAHESPVNIAKSRVDQCGKKNHSGMGSIYKNAYEAEIKLRKQCQKSPTIVELGKFCQKASSDLNYSSNMTLNDVAAGATNLYFKSYTSDVLISEIKISGENPYPLPACLKGVNSNSAPHLSARESAMEPSNMVSAGVLMEIYDGHIFSSGFENYTERLTETFPLLFKPKSRGQGLADFVEDSLGDKYDYSNKDGRSHSDIMDAFNTLYSNDEEFEKNLNQKVEKIKKSYARDLKNKLANICKSDPMQIQKDHPAIFKQAILDMNDNQRVGANQYLCKQKDYYNKDKYDSDCDGEVDSKDIEPGNPFSPDPKQSHSGRDVSDPPFGSKYDYDVNVKNNEVQLSTELTFNTSSMTKDEAASFKKKVVECNQKLESSMNSSFEKLKKENSNYSGKMNTKIDIKFGDFRSPSFNVTKCYCADCKDRVVDPDDSTTLIFITNYIDHTKCWDDLTDNQKEAVKKVFPEGSGRWRNRANAANLNDAVSCRTIKHEILHRFGLPDEYSDRNSYPYNRIACNLMGDYSGGDLIEGRHIESIISPEKCE
jgi:hypothetical protein